MVGEAQGNLWHETDQIVLYCWGCLMFKSRRWPVVVNVQDGLWFQWVDATQASNFSAGV
jgi:hypothetical protein